MTLVVPVSVGSVWLDPCRWTAVLGTVLPAHVHTPPLQEQLLWQLQSGHGWLFPQGQEQPSHGNGLVMSVDKLTVTVA
jgi:hypothetical protein